MCRTEIVEKSKKTLSLGSFLSYFIEDTAICTHAVHFHNRYDNSKALVWVQFLDSSVGFCLEFASTEG